MYDETIKNVYVCRGINSQVPMQVVLPCIGLCMSFFPWDTYCCILFLPSLSHPGHHSRLPTRVCVLFGSCLPENSRLFITQTQLPVQDSAQWRVEETVVRYQGPLPVPVRGRLGQERPHYHVQGMRSSHFFLVLSVTFFLTLFSPSSCFPSAQIWFFSRYF